MQNHTNTIIAIDCPMMVAFKSTCELLQGGRLAHLPAESHAPDRPLRRPLKPKGLACYRGQLTNEWVSKREEQRDTNTDHGNRVEQSHDEKHFRLQHRSQFRLTRTTLEEAATEQTHADTNTEGAKADQKCDSDRGITKYNFHQLLLEKAVLLKVKSLMN